MNLVVRLVYIVSLAVVLFHENGCSLHIDANKNTKRYDGDIHENVQPIEHISDTPYSEDLNVQLEEKENVETLYDLFTQELEEQGDSIVDKSTDKNRVVRQANGNLYPQLGTSYYGNQQYYPTPGQGMPPNNSSWNSNTYPNNSNPYNPLANITFNQYPTPSYPHSQNNYHPGGSPYNSPGSSYNNPGLPSNNQGSPYNNPGSPYNNPGSPYNNPSLPFNNHGPPYHSPQGQGYNQFNNSRPGQQYPYDSTSRYPTYPQNPYPSKNNFNASRNSSSHYGNSGQSYGTHNTGYPTPPSFNAASPRPGYPHGQYNSTQWQGNPNTNNTYGHNNYNGGRPGQHNFYPNTSPKYPQGQYPINTNHSIPINGTAYNGGPGQTYGNFNPIYPSPPPFHSPSPRPVTPYGQNNSAYNPHWDSSYGNQSRPHVVNGFNNSNPYGHNNNNNYNPHKYPNSNPNPQYGNNNPNYPMYPSPPPFHSPSPRPVTPYGQNNSAYNPHWDSSYGNQSRPHVVNGFNNSNPYGHNNNNNYNPNNYPNSNPNPQYGNNNPNYPTPPPYTNGNLRPTHGIYPLPQNNGQSSNNWNPVQPYNPDNPNENTNLFNYPSKYNTTNPNSMYDPRRNPPHNFSY